MENRNLSSSIGDHSPSMFHRRSQIARRGGFSFAEVMFAVVILGIGFILIAAIFPVAIQQSQVTGEESNGASLARQAASIVQGTASTTITTTTTGITTFTSGKGYIANTVYDPTYPLVVGTPSPNDCKSVSEYPIFPPTVKNYLLGTGAFSLFTVPSNLVVGGSASVTPVAGPPPAVVAAMIGSRWDLVKANTASASDPRFAYSLFYKRENGSSSAEVFVVGLTSRNSSVYTPSTNEMPSNYNPQTGLLPTASISTAPGAVPATAALQTTICPDTITISGGNPQPSEGWYAQTAATSISPTPQLRTYTLGSPLSGANSFEMWPGDTMSLTAGSNGNWGTAGRITDAPLSGVSGSLGSPGTLQPTVAYAFLKTDPDAPAGRIYLSASPFSSVNKPTPASPLPAAAVTGAFVIIADDCPCPGTTANYLIPQNIPGFFSVGALNGRIFRLGTAVNEDFAENVQAQSVGMAIFNLDPQYGMRPAGLVTGGPNFSPDVLPNPVNPFFPIGQPGVQAAKVYIIGAGADPTTGVVGGKAQDIGVFASYFQVQ